MRLFLFVVGLVLLFTACAPEGKTHIKMKWVGN